MRSTFGILALMGLLASSSATVLNYRVTGTFDEATEDLAPLLGTTFSYDFSYDTDATNLGDETGAVYLMNGTRLTTDLVSTTGAGEATIDLDPEYGSMGFWGAAFEYGVVNVAYGLHFGDLPPMKADLPTDLVAFSQAHAADFFLVAQDNAPRFNGTGLASASRVSIQAVPEPASMVALGVGAVGLLRRRARRGL